MGRFKKGQSGNPKGRPPLSAPIKAFYAKARHDVALRVMQLVSLTKDEAEALSKDPSLQLWERGVIAVAISTIRHGDVNRLEKLMTLAFGPQKVPIELTGKDGKSLIPRDPTLTGKKLTETIDTIRALMAAKRAGKLQTDG